MSFGDFSQKIFLGGSLLERVRQIEEAVFEPNDRGRLMSTLATLMPDMVVSRISSPDTTGGDNLISINPGFETGDLTGWSGSDDYVGASWGVSSSSSYEGSYAAGFMVPTLSSSGFASLGCDHYSITPGNSAVIKIAVYYSNLSGIEIGVNFFDSEDVFIEAEPILEESGSGLSSGSWVEVTDSVIVPSGADYCQVYVRADFPGGAGASFIHVDAAEIRDLVKYSYNRLDKYGFYGGNESEEINLLGWNQSELQFAVQAFTEVTIARTVDTSVPWGFYVGPNAGNSADGDEYLYQFVLAPGVYTMHVAGMMNLQCGMVDYYLDNSVDAFASGDDWYELSAETPAEKEFPNIVIGTGGRHLVKVKVNGTSGSYYRWLNTAIWFNRSEYTLMTTPPEVVATTDALLLETGDYLLTENGDHILME